MLKPIISLHPIIEADIYLITANKPLLSPQKKLIKQAKAIIMHQACRGDVYWFCRTYCPHVFPNYDYRFPGEGKIGDTLLWQTLKLPHPKTEIYPDVNTFFTLHSGFKKLPFSYPFILKGNRGGEGEMVFFIENEKQLKNVLDLIRGFEINQNWHGFILQEFIPHDRSLRVVIIGRKRFYYWRIQKQNWKVSVAHGAEIDKQVSKKIKKEVDIYLKKLCYITGI
ncbi:MAG TPA: hypothetical protein ENG24_03445, partial [Thermoplasmatales archaeon]|nr:hypothetical protein [Thermoplasmatales archaeon]